MPRDAESLVDSTLDRELEALLAVEPSAQFNARVMAGVADARPRWALVWRLVPGGALAVAVLVLGLVTHSRTTVPVASTLTRHPFVSPLVQAPQITAWGLIRTDVAVSTRSRRQPARVVGSAARRAETEPVVLLAVDESRALGRLLARARPLQVSWPTDDSPLPLSPSADAPEQPLHVPRLVIEPLPSSEERPEGVRP